MGSLPTVQFHFLVVLSDGCWRRDTLPLYRDMSRQA